MYHWVQVRKMSHWVQVSQTSPKIFSNTSSPLGFFIVIMQKSFTIKLPLTQIVLGIFPLVPTRRSALAESFQTAAFRNEQAKPTAVSSALDGSHTCTFALTYSLSSLSVCIMGLSRPQTPHN